MDVVYAMYPLPSHVFFGIRCDVKDGEWGEQKLPFFHIDVGSTSPTWLLVPTRTPDLIQCFDHLGLLELSSGMVSGITTRNLLNINGLYRRL